MNWLWHLLCSLALLALLPLMLARDWLHERWPLSSHGRRWCGCPSCRRHERLGTCGLFCVCSKCLPRAR